MSNSQKNFMTIRSKLLAAVAMLLVASFMVVSSTYAWFTLSTAPEVTGITTQVGANGNLEIALYGGALPENGMGLTDVLESNRTWGNIVDLSNGYGLNNIVLKPSVLALGDGATLDQTTPLITPTYGSDGRIKELSKNGFYGRWNETGFVRAGEGNEGYGVRALGTASSMTAQQLQYANASSAVKTNLDAAYNAASISLVSNGSGLVTLILKGVADADTAEFNVVDDPLTEGTNENELAALGNMIAALKGAPANIELAIKNYMIAALAKAQETVSDNEFALIVGAFNSNWETLFGQMKSGSDKITVTVAAGEGVTGGSYEVAVPPVIASVITAYNDVNSKVTAASNAYDAAVATAGGKVDFETVKGVLLNLMEMDKLAINGRDYADIMADPDKVNWAIGVVTKGIEMEMKAGSGVYASVASVTKNIDVTFTAVGVKASYGGQDIGPLDLNIRMFTDLEDITRLNPTAIGEPAAKDTEADAVISDTYGYVLDFAFRTNAAGSSLLLQQDASDRIYSESQDAESATWGGGSYMEFSTQAGFGDKEVKNLMKHVRIVFVDTLTGDILALAGLASESATFDGSNVKAAVLLQEYTIGEIDETGLSKIVAGEFITEKDDQVIVELGQNEPTYISAYVYLDGETITNADVAAVSELSTSGKLNLQFASSADLVPMDYSDLKPKN
ncbi:MAG: hypothetical protein E7603_04255 [Ruminococcaceae bacterium]|nr:hypothetical protein [Oscillospiraceae bacterium]